jgi:hypothetical protein
MSTPSSKYKIPKKKGGDKAATLSRLLGNSVVSPSAAPKTVPLLLAALGASMTTIPPRPLMAIVVMMILLFLLLILVKMLCLLAILSTD